MKDENSNRVKLLLNPQNRQILEHLSRGDSTVKEIVKQLRMDSAQVYYRIKQLEDAKLIQVVHTKKRWGKGTKVYHLNTRNVLIPLSEVQSEEIEKLLFEQMSAFIKQLLADFIASCQENPSKWVMTMETLEGQLGFSIRPLEGFESLKSSILGDFGQVYLSPTEATTLIEHLRSIALTHLVQEKGDSKYSLGLFLIKDRTRK